MIEYTLEEERLDCPMCGNDLHVMTKEICKELKEIPAQISIVEHVAHVAHIYSCRICENIKEQAPL